LRVFIGVNRTFRFSLPSRLTTSKRNFCVRICRTFSVSTDALADQRFSAGLRTRSSQDRRAWWPNSLWSEGRNRRPVLRFSAASYRRRCT